MYDYVLASRESWLGKDDISTCDRGRTRHDCTIPSNADRNTCFSNVTTKLMVRDSPAI